MGTNYYLHLGKTSSQGNGKPMLYQMASDVTTDIDAHKGTVQDEYGKEMSWTEFTEIFTRCIVDTSALGQEFC